MRRPEVGHDLTGIDPLLQLCRAAATEEGRAAAGRELGVEEDGQPEFLADAPREVERRLARAVHVARPDGNDRHDVGGADMRVNTLVLTQIDPLAGNRDSSEQRLCQLLGRADDREHRAVVVSVRVDVEHARVCPERVAERGNHRGIPPLGKVRNRFERQLHGVRLRGKERCAVLAHVRRHETEPHPEIERLTTDAQAEHRLQGGEHDDDSHEHERGGVETDGIPE